ncbi:MAG: hypothetical protein JWO30_678 [Fibrobacteres bacterium]|nr:hypothetical protein [Fibrobacterota bacterium]
MAPNPASFPKTESTRKSGILSLFLLEEPIPVQGEPVSMTPAYARFRLCRGFIDDLTRILPIRLRIQLEGDLANGATSGQVDGPPMRFRWEFREH